MTDMKTLLSPRAAAVLLAAAATFLVAAGPARVGAGAPARSPGAATARMSRISSYARPAMAASRLRRMAARTGAVIWAR